MRVLDLEFTCMRTFFFFFIFAFPAYTAASPAFAATRQCTATGECVQSPNYPDDYGRFERCVITVERDGVLDVEAFDLEDGYDFLTLNGMVYTGTSGPGVAVEAGDEMFSRRIGTNSHRVPHLSDATADMTPTTTTPVPSARRSTDAWPLRHAMAYVLANGARHLSRVDG